MKVQKIYFDMDGVLADFDNGVRTLCHMEPIEQGHHTPADDDRLFAAMREVDHYYFRLQPIPGALELFREVQDRWGDKCEILTGIPKQNRGIYQAKEDKEHWVRELLGPEVKVNAVLRKEKPLYCTGPECILIDDFFLNISQWRDIGGTGILFKGVDSTRKKLQTMGLI